MQKNNNKKFNKLINEKSPYLLQHAYNPVDWYPWCEEAFEMAKKDDKPIFLSIGYSTCHWCHVMAHESFEDEEVSEMMNKVFVNIKVDREERPDIDSVYMQVCQMITGGGGWPLTVIMTPDKKPFFAGTYFPKESVINRIGMKELISRVDELWRTNKDDILLSADDMVQKLSNNSYLKSGALCENVFDKAYEMLWKSYDGVFGGFGDSPKFPIANNLYFLMSYYDFKKDLNSLNMVESTLKKMGSGGIYDHIGFGFHRYSTDRKWLVPHFEKMLYDQALLVKAYTIAWQISRRDYYKNKVFEILDYVSRELLTDNGGFYSAEDADSEEVEGKFYLWKAIELRELLGDDYYLCKKYFGVKEEGNFRDEKTGEFNGECILHFGDEYELEDLELIGEEDKLKIESIRKRLFELRQLRIHPFKDKKILTDWNGLMMEAMAFAGRVFRNQSYTEIAIKNFRYLNSKKTPDGLLFHSVENGIQANLDDYAFLGASIIELYRTTFDIRYIKEAVKLQEVLIKHFWDEKQGGFFFTSDFSEKIIVRKKEIYDGAIPSGNSVELMNLIKLYRITGDIRYKKYIDGSVRCFSGSVNEYPIAYTYFLNSLMMYLNISHEIVFVVKDFQQVAPYLEILNGKYIPNLSIIVKTEINGDELSEIAKFTKDMIMQENKPTMYFCSEYKCEYPINDNDLILKTLKALE